VRSVRGSQEDYEIQTPDSWDDFIETVSLAWGGLRQAVEVNEHNAKVFEPKRSLLIRKGGEPCATTAVYSLEMSVPGGPRPVAGIGCVTVSPAHRRQGLMRTLMHRVLEGIHDSGQEPIAALNTTEAAIYGRFGFGLASQALRLTIPRGSAALDGYQSDVTLRARVEDPQSCRDAIAEIYRANWVDRPGMMHRDDGWARMAVLDPAEHREGAARLLCLLVDDDIGVRGYALYALRPHWEHSCPRFEVSVRELFAKDPAAYAHLWRVLLDLDLSATVVADVRPVDDPVLALLTDSRSAVPVIRDQLYVRLVDVDRALAGRRYATDIDVVLDVTDPQFPWNEGRWRLRGDDEAAQCVRTNDDADLALSARELGAVFLGGGSLVQLARAGRVTELHPGSLKTTAIAFRSELAPFCQTIF
jgi:predicted acetyltransferase